MTYKELAKIVNKKPSTVAIFFSRHRLSIKSNSDLSFYLQQINSKKRLESGKRKANHLKPYQFKVDKNKLEKARKLLSVRNLIWYSDPKKLSLESIIEHVLSNGNFEDFQEILRLLGKIKVKEIFKDQISKARNNYKPETANFFKHYFKLNA